MDWRKRSRFMGYQIWAATLRGRWVASLTPLGEAVTNATLPGERVVPGDFPSLEAAEDAARTCVMELQRR